MSDTAPHVATVGDSLTLAKGIWASRDEWKYGQGIQAVAEPFLAYEQGHGVWAVAHPLKESPHWTV